MRLKYRRPAQVPWRRFRRHSFASLRPFRGGHPRWPHSSRARSVQANKKSQAARRHTSGSDSADPLAAFRFAQQHRTPMSITPHLTSLVATLSTLRPISRTTTHYSDQAYQGALSTPVCVNEKRSNRLTLQMDPHLLRSVPVGLGRRSGHR